MSEIKRTPSALAEDIHRICGTNNPLTPLGIARSFKADVRAAAEALEQLVSEGRAENVGGERYQLIKPGMSRARKKRVSHG